MRSDRRAFLRAAAALTATGALPTLGWAQAGAPDFLAAAKTGEDAYVLCGLTAAGELRFKLPMPGRGHAAAAHPHRAHAVAFARRPGTFALVIDCALGLEMARLETPDGRHFYGHGAFDRTGRFLYTGENAYETGEGVIGVWDAEDGYARVGEFSSGGVAPHEVVIDHPNDRLVIANGGIRTHPDSGREKLNLATMRPNVAYVDRQSGALLQTVEQPEDLHKNGLRHIAVRPDGLVAAATQWEGSLRKAPPLLALHRFGEQELRLCSVAGRAQARLRGYAGSVAFSGDGKLVAITCPRGGAAHIYDAETGELAQVYEKADVCGVAPCPQGFVATDGAGGVALLDGANAPRPLSTAALSWDNHLVRLEPAPV